MSAEIPKTLHGRSIQELGCRGIQKLESGSAACSVKLNLALVNEHVECCMLPLWIYSCTFESEGEHLGTRPGLGLRLVMYFLARFVCLILLFAMSLECEPTSVDEILWIAWSLACLCASVSVETLCWSPGFEAQPSSSSSWAWRDDEEPSLPPLLQAPGPAEVGFKRFLKWV